MITKITGWLESLGQDAATVVLQDPLEDRAAPGLTYAVLLPAYTTARLGGSIGQAITLHTLYYMESQGQGATIFPRLLGFQTATDRAFFELFTTCKGIGHRKALRAMTLETNLIAAAIADRDAATLQSLPEIGKRTAETIIATLRGKVDRFLDTTTAAMTTDAKATPQGSSPGSPTAGSSLVRQTLEVLLQLGENRVEALRWIDQVLQANESPPTDAQDLIQEVYRLKARS